MSTYLYLTFGDRTVMVAKPATYQDLKREIRKQFPMLASVFSVLILFKPSLEDGSLLDNWVEVDPSAYNAVHNSAQVFINVAEPITKRYMFPFPDGRNSNVGPLNQDSHTSGMGNHASPSMDGVPHDGQVSIKNSRTSRSKYHSPDSMPSPKLHLSDGAACASGWAGASEKFHRSAKLIPNLKDCKEAVGLEVGESNCYPDEEEDADKNWGHFQGEDEEEEEPNTVLTEKGWYTGAEDSARGDKQADNVPLDNWYDNCPATLTAKGDFSYEDDQHDGNDAGKKVPIPHANNMRTAVPYHIRPTGDYGPPTDGSAPEEDSSWRYHRDLGKNMCTITPRSRSESEWSSRDGAQNGVRGFCLGPSDYVENPPCGSPSSPYAESMNEGYRPTRKDCVATLNQEENTDQHAHTAYTYDLNEFDPSARTAPAAHCDDGLANQVSQNAHNHSRDYGGSDWSPPRRQYSGPGWPQQPQLQTQAQPKPPYPLPFYSSPPYGSFSLAGPGQYTTGSPVAKFRRSSHLPHCITAGQKKHAWANAGNHPEAQIQKDNDDGNNEQKYGFQNRFGDGGGNDGLDHGDINRSHAEGEHDHEQYQCNDAEDFWYAPPANATKSVGGGGAFKRSGRAMYDKMTTNKPRQEDRAGRNMSNTGWGELSKTGMW